MIVSAIADPTIFGPAMVTDELASREVLLFLRGIILNGVLLCDPAMQLVKDAMIEADTLAKQPGGTQRGQRIFLVLQEIFKQHKKYIVPCDATKWKAANLPTVVDQIVFLHAHLKADIVVAPNTWHAVLNGKLTKPIEVACPRNISISRYESLRIRIASPGKPLDEMTIPEIEEAVGRSVKYCDLLRIYDFRMVAGEKTGRKYRDGIQFLLAIWVKWCVVADGSSRTAELYTVGDTTSVGGFLTGAVAKTRLANDIVTPVKATGGCNVVGHVVYDNQNMFHARGFEAKQRAFTIDPGFDALGKAGPVRRCLLKADGAAERHFEQCRNLREL